MTEAEAIAFAREKGCYNECHDELRKMERSLAGELANPRMERFVPEKVRECVENLDFISRRMQRAAQGFTTWQEARDAIWDAGFKPAWKHREDELAPKRGRIQAPAKIEVMPVNFPSDQLPDLGPEFEVLTGSIENIIKMGKAS